GVDPLRVVLGKAPAGARVLPALEFEGDLPDLLDLLGERRILQVLVEGGATVAGSFHREGLVDHYVVYFAPAIFGGDDAMPLFAGPSVETIRDVWRGAITEVTQLGGDLRIDVSPVVPSPVTGPVPVVRLDEDTFPHIDGET
ncbi:MAG: dihydrofolate reductase family protein, partial [Aquihabitans sp.]